MQPTSIEERWYAVRCVLRSEPTGDAAAPLYEERITLWRSGSVEDAIERAEVEAAEYAAIVGAKYVRFAQSYHLATKGDVGDGAEVFSLVRQSALAPAEYLNHFFDTGTERQRHV